MAYTFDTALNDPLIHVEERDDSSGYFSIRIGKLKTLIYINLGRYMDSETTNFRVSHAIHTPEQAGPYRTSRQTGDYPAYALHHAISGLIDYYKMAVRNGHTPKESWLVAN